MSARPGAQMQLSAAAKLQARYEAALPAIRARSAELLGPSLAEQLMQLPEEQREAILAELTPADFASLLCEWNFWARPKQQPPWSDLAWRWMLYMAGRGSGKSRTGAEFVRWMVEHGAGAIGLLGPTYRHVAHFMLGGRKGRKGNGSGLLDVFPAHQKPRWFKSDGIVEFYTGAVAYVFTGEDEEIRGPNLDGAWVDEPIKIRGILELFMNLELTMRADDVTPRGIITTTGKPIPWLKKTIARKDVYVVLGASDENAANLDPSLLRTLDQELSGSRLERQERGGEIVEDDEGALFRMGDISDNRVPRAPELVEVLVAVDPAATDTNRADECGVVGVGMDALEELYVLDDKSGKLDPEGYGDAAIAMFFALRRAHPAAKVSLLVEDNKIGKHAASTVRAAMRDKRGRAAAQAITITELHALGDKATRADPVATLYRKGLVHHVGTLAELEAEITTWTPGKKSPNRLDALVHACTKLARLDEDPLAPAEDPTTAHAESRWARKADAALAQTADEYEDNLDAGDAERGGTWGGFG
jgi:phage terminase large subunit-like protein